MADTTRDIELRLRARDLSTAELKQVVASVNQLSSALDNQLAAASRLEIKERELRSTLTQLDQAAKNISGLTAIVERAKLLSEQLERNRADLDKAAEALKNHQAAMAAGTATGKAAEAMLTGLEGKLKQAQGALDRNSKTLTDYTSQLNAAGIEARELAVAEQQLAATASQIGDARTKLNNTIRDIPRLEREAREAAKATAQANRDAAEAAKQKAAADAAAAKAALDARRAALGGGPTGFREFSQRVDRERELNALLAQLNRQRGNDETRQARAVVDAIRQAERDKAQARIQGAQFNPANPTAVPGQPRTDATGRVNRGAATQRGFLGLRPYEVTNLGYQANDVIGGLAQGQNPVQILAQQSGQIFQIFTTAATRYNDELRAAGKETVNFGAMALRWFPLAAAAIVGVTVVVSTLATEMRKLSSNREFTAALTTNKFASDQSAESLTRLRRELNDLGVSWDDAGKVIQAMLAANVLPAAQSQFARLAEAIARTRDLDIKSVTADLIEGFSGGQVAFENLIKKYPALDAEQVKRIRRLYEEGRADEAQRVTLQALLTVFEKGRKEYLSPFDESAEKLRKTWHALLDQLAEKGAFSYVEKTLIFFVQGIQNMITTTEAFVKMLDSIDKRFPWLKYVALGPVGLAKGIADAASGAFGGAGGTGGPVTALPIPAGSNQEITRKFLQEKGYSAEAIAGIMGNIKIESNFDTGAKNDAFRATGGVGGHFGLGQWDATRRAPLAGSTNIIEQLTLLDNELNKLDPDFKKAAQSAEQAALRFEKAFERSGGQKNAERVAAAKGFYAGMDTGGGIGIGAAQSPEGASGGVIGPNAGRVIGLEQDIKRQNDALALQKASTRAAQEALIVKQAQQEVEEKIAAAGTEQEKQQIRSLQNTFVQNKLEEHRQQTRAQDFERESARAKLAETDKNREDTARAEKAGRDAVSVALANNITNYEQLEAIKDKGAAEERARIAKERSDREALQELRKGFANDARALELKHASDLVQALDAVNKKYEERIQKIDKLKDHSKDLSDETIKGLKEEAAQLKAKEEAEARITAAKKGADEALSARGDAIKTINRLEELGEITLQQKEDMTKKAYEDSKGSILAMADALEKTIDPTRMSATEVEKLTNQVKLLRAESKYVDPFWKGLKETFTSSFSSGLATAFDTVSQAIGGAIAKTKEWKDVWSSLKAAAANMIAGLLKDLAMYILKAQAAKLASSIFGGTGIGDFFGLAKPAASAAGAAATSATTTAASTSTGLFGFGFLGLKAGGVAGRVPPSGVGDPSWWAGAPKYRSGTVVGLAPDEQRAILHMGEEVLSADNPRNVLNGGGRSGPISIRNVLVDDKRRIAEAMQGAHGERVIVQHLIRNGATIREIARG